MKLNDPELLEKPRPPFREVKSLPSPKWVMGRDDFKSHICLHGQHKQCMWQDCVCLCHSVLGDKLLSEKNSSAIEIAAKEIRDARQVEKDEVLCMHSIKCIVSDCQCRCHLLEAASRLKHEMLR